MRWRSIIPLCFLAFAAFQSAPLPAQQPAVDGTPGKTQAYVVPFSHLDRFWGGTGEECLARGNRIIAKAVQLAKQYPEFKFLVESDNFVANFVETHAGSQELDDLKRLVKEGRIEIAPNWTNLFLNLPDGEAVTRNILYGKGYARSVFGVDPLVYHPTDIPGFTPQFPQILQSTGTPFMTMTRMGPEKSLFYWASPDGSKELVWNVHGYGWGASLQLHNELTEEAITKIKREIEERIRTRPAGTPTYIHLGIDLWAPSEKTIRNIQRLNEVFAPGYFTIATSKEYFNAVAKTPGLDQLSGEIPMSWPHVVDGILHLWQLIPPAMSTLETAEEFAAVNYALGYANYPQEDFDLLWTRLLDSMDHNHDGQGGDIGDNRKKEYSQLAIIRGGEILRNMQRNIAERVQVPIAHSVPIVVFNGLGWQRDDIVREHLTIYGDVVPSQIEEYRKGAHLVDETGKSVPFYVIQTSENISRAMDLTFVAQGVPALGYKTYYLAPTTQTESLPPTSQMALDRDQDRKDPRRPLGLDVIENQFYRLKVDKATGAVDIFDKQLNRDISKDTQITGVEERGSNNVQPEKDTGRVFPMAITETGIEENNGVRTVFRINGLLSGIPIVQRLVLYAGLKRLDIEDSLDWEEPRLLRIQQQFPVTQPNAQVVYGVPFGANAASNIMPGSGPDNRFIPNITDELNEEAWRQYRVIQDWIFAGTPESGMTIAADHQLVRLTDNVIAANMVRGQRYTSVKIDSGDEVTSIHFPPRGHYVFNFSLTSGPGDWKTARSYQAGRSLTHPLLPVSILDELSHKTLPPSNSFLSIQADNVVLSAVKKAESGRSVIVRFYEIQGAKAETPVTFLGKQQAFRETDLLERDLRSTDQRVLHVNPYEIKTIKLETETPKTGKASDGVRR
jgi:alpha-mannosidase